MSDVTPEIPAWAIAGGWVVTVVVAWISTRRAVNKHGNEEMEGLREIRSELSLMRQAQSSSNELFAQVADTSARRVGLLEQRVDRLEERIF